MHILYDEVKGIKRCVSPDYNYHFNMKTGEFNRWGKTLKDDPVAGPVEIFDLEVSEACSGIPAIGSDVAVPCTFCYKSNTKVGREMSFETFKTIFDKIPQTLTQIAFGIGDTHGPKDFAKMLDYCRNNEHNPGVVPNLTINGWGLIDELVALYSSKLGACAVSRYDNSDICYDAVKKLTDAGMTQINIHMLLACETLNDCYQVIDDAVNDPRLEKLNAIVFLTLKPKGKRNKFTTLKNVNEYRDLVQYAFDRDIGVGFDSCSAPTFLAAMKDHPKFEMMAQLSESCESTLFSMYANVVGEFFPCSFTEGERGWETGIDLTKIENFNKEVWNDPRTVAFRNKNIETTDESICSDCRKCVTFPDLYDAAIVHQPHVDARKKFIPITEETPMIVGDNSKLEAKIELFKKLGLS